MNRKEILKFIEPYGKRATGAFKKGGNFRFQPECAESDRIRISSCDCEQGWHRYFVEYGLEIEKGDPYLVRWDIDSDGDWEPDLIPLSEIQEDYIDKEDKEHHQSVVKYYAHVYRTGEDPLGEFSPPTPPEEKFVVSLEEKNGGVYLTFCHRGGKRRRNFLPGELPENICQFFHCKQDGLIQDEEFRTLDAVLGAENIKKRGGKRKNSQTATVEFTDKGQWTKTQQKKLTIEAAQRALADEMCHIIKNKRWEG